MNAGRGLQWRRGVRRIAREAALMAAAAACPLIFPQAWQACRPFCKVHCYSLLLCVDIGGRVGLHSVTWGFTLMASGPPGIHRTAAVQVRWLEAVVCKALDLLIDSSFFLTASDGLGPYRYCQSQCAYIHSLPWGICNSKHCSLSWTGLMRAELR